MTKRELELKLKSLQQSLALIHQNKQDFLAIMSEKDLERYIDDILDQINHYKRILNNINK